MIGTLIYTLLQFPSRTSSFCSHLGSSFCRILAIAIIAKRFNGYPRLPTCTTCRVIGVRNGNMRLPAVSCLRG
ncbi:hypothetical protein BKA60DRAFT_568585 [Fusarium oxysporum]|nr:hypothetical protein BKA60DRAFT_568585 [Fusarium oxysporum]